MLQQRICDHGGWIKGYKIYPDRVGMEGLVMDDEIIAVFASSPIDSMRGRGKQAATASAVTSPTTYLTTNILNTCKSQRTKHSFSKRHRTCRDEKDSIISILVLSEPIIGYKHGRHAP